ncbi:MAG: DMT family transporter [Pseudobdellovibrio sp.]
MISIFYALGSNFSFAIASHFFTEFSRKVSPVWMNYFKATIAFFCFSSVVLLFQIPWALNQAGFFLLASSGVIGLLIGDIFLLSAFTHLGSGRVLMIFGFQPLILGISGYFLFQQSFEWHRLFAVLFFMLCLLSFSVESFKEKGDWQIKGITFALIGVILDAGGILLTKKSFDMNPELSAFVANTVRSGATMAGFFLVSLFLPKVVHLKKSFISLTVKDKRLVVFASVLGTFCSLAFYLKAIQIGHLATISAIAGTSPLFATIFEVLQGQKKMTAYLGVAISSFIIGFLILIFF